GAQDLLEAGLLRLRGVGGGVPFGHHRPFSEHVRQSGSLDHAHGSQECFANAPSRSTWPATMRTSWRPIRLSMSAYVNSLPGALIPTTVTPKRSRIRASDSVFSLTYSGGRILTT